MSLSMFGGLAKGFAMGRQQKLEREREKELDDLKKQMLKIQAESQKVALEEAKRKNKLVDLLMMGGQSGGQGGKESGPAFSDNFSEAAFAAGTGQTPVNAPASTGTGFAEQASLMGMMQDPQMVALLKMAGIDIGDAARLSQTQQQNEWRRLVDMARLAQGEQHFQQGTRAAVTYQSIENPDGSKTLVALPTHAGGAPGSMVPVQTAPSAAQSPIKESDLPLWINSQGQTPGFGVTPQQAMEGGFKRISTNQRTTMDSMVGARKVLQKIEEGMKGLFPQQGGVFERATGGVKRSVGAWTQMNPKANQLQGLIRGTVAPIIRALGEKGTLAEGDTERALALLPKMGDSADVAWLKIRELQGMFDDINAAVVGNAYDPKKGLGERQLSREKAIEILNIAGGDKTKAEAIAKEMGFKF